MIARELENTKLLTWTISNKHNKREFLKQSVVLNGPPLTFDIG